MNNKRIEQGLVSVLTPCYNGAKTMNVFLSSLIEQTYRPIELIFINDASTDDTKEVFHKWMPCLQQNSIRVKYIQAVKNGGLGQACNLGLKHIHGEFLTQFDCDDIMLPTRIERLVYTLKNNPTCDIIYHPYDVVDVADLNKPLYQIRLNRNKTNMLMNLLKDDDWIGQCGYLMRTQALINAIPELNIYPSRSGQNFQIQIPINYFGTYCYLDETLSKYIIYPKSLSRKTDKTKTVIFFKHWNEVHRIFKQTINHMGISKDEKKRLLCITRQTVCKRKKDFIDTKLVNLKKSLKAFRKKIKHKLKTYLRLT